MKCVCNIFAFVAFLSPSFGATLTPPNLRLPQLARPRQYKVDLRLVPGDDHFKGSAEIGITVLQRTSVLWLHGKSLVIGNATIQAGGSVLDAKAESVGGDFIAITADREFAPGDVTLRIFYTGDLSRTLTDGVFQQRDGNDWYIFTKFEPVTARRAFPCFDEPSYKTPWQLTLHVPAKLRAFSNTPAESERDEGNGMKVVRFQKSKPLPSYLVAFAVGPLETVNTAPIGRNRVSGRIIVPSGRQAEASYAASTTPTLMALLEDYYGTPYPYEKLDQVVVPVTTAWGAMENAGLIAYGDFLLAPPKEDTPLRQRRRTLVMLHEMSHQWFGDLVTTAWWDDIWLNEAFANWLSAKLLDVAHPDWKLRPEEVSFASTMRTDSLASARRIRQPIEAPGDIANAFDGITYDKGSQVIAMFENYLKPEVFQDAIRQYLGRHAWGNATAADLLAAIDTVVGPGNGAAFATFLSQGGFPFLRVKLNCDSTRAALEISQDRFIPLGSQVKPGGLWQAPVCVKWGDTGGVHSQCSLESKAHDTILLQASTSCPVWLFANQNAAGYYTVAYDPREFESLIRQGIGKLTLAERVSILRDMQLMFSSGMSDAPTALTAAREFSRDSDRIVLRQTEALISSVDDLVPSKLRPNYARFIQTLYGGRARELGWKPKLGESEDTRQLRLALVGFVAVLGQDRSLQEDAGRLARTWLQNHQSLDPDVVEPVLQVAAYNGDQAFFDSLVAAAKTTKVKRERDWIIGGMGSFRDPVIEKSALDLIWNSDLDARELIPILFSARKESRDVVWDFVRKNFDRLNSKLPGARGIPFGSSLPLTSAGYCDESHRQQIDAFFQSRIASLSGGKRNLDNVLERVRLCSIRADLLRPGLVQFLAEQ
jgi:alanyl aminopeptidase